MHTYDLVILNGRVIDPASRTEGKYNIGVKDGMIHTLTLAEIDGERQIDAAGLVVSPGFIDIHTHVDGNPKAGLNMARMGNTTAIGGNCGSFFGLSDEEREKLVESQEDIGTLIQSKEGIGEMLDRVEKEGFPVNLGMLVGGWFLRQRAGMGDKMAPAKPEQIEQMVLAAEDLMTRGAFGVSFGLAYAPGTSRDELVSLFKVAARHDGIAAIHPRHAAHGFPGFEPDAIAAELELVEAARLSGARLQIAHLAHQLAFPAIPYDSLLTRGLQVIEEARRQGIDVMADCLPDASFSAAVSMPALDMIASPAFEKIYGMRIQDAFIISEGPHKGERLTLDLYHKLRREAPNTGLQGFLMREDLMVRTLTPSFCMVSSDASTGGIPVPVIVLEKMVRQKSAISLMDALAKMTIMPARRLGLTNKGRIAAGADTDFVIFDPDTIGVTTDAMEPDFKTRGLEYVIVNGVPVLDQGVLQDVKPGKVLRHVPWQ